MKRRDLLKRTMLLGAAGLSLPVPRLYAAPFEGYSGRLLVTVQCDGGWDVASFCDPKTNQPDEKKSPNGQIAMTSKLQEIFNTRPTPIISLSSTIITRTCW
jgi:hypothetical protein